MILDREQQKIDVRISDIVISIAPAAIRTLIHVTSSLGTLQVCNESELRFYIEAFYFIILFFVRRLFKKQKTLT